MKNMEKTNVPYLCGGTFFLLLLQAKEKREKAMGIRKTSRTNNVDVFTGLVSIFRSVKSLCLAESTLKSVVSDYRCCKGNSTIRVIFPYPEDDRDNVLQAYDEDVRNSYGAALQKMNGFIAECLRPEYHRNASDSISRNIDELKWLIKALLEVLEKDTSIGDCQAFYALENGAPIAKKDLLCLKDYCVSSFLLGIWHFILMNRPDNERGRATFEDWNKQDGGYRTQWTFTSDIGANFPRAAKVYMFSDKGKENIEQMETQEATDVKMGCSTRRVMNTIVEEDAHEEPLQGEPVVLKAKSEEKQQAGKEQQTLISHNGRIYKQKAKKIVNIETMTVNGSVHI